MFRIAYILEREGDIAVQNDLVLSPAQVKELTKKGKNASLPEMPPENFDDGTLDNDLIDSELPLIHRRSVDINDVWLEQQESIRKFNEAKERSKNERMRKLSYEKEMKRLEKELEESQKNV